MKFFTIEKYERLQISGQLVYHENQKDIDIWKERFAAMGRNFEEEERQNFFIAKPLMLKYLPEPIKKGIYDETIIPSKIPPADLLKQISQWSQSIKDEWEEAFKEYQMHLETIKGCLPEEVYQLHAKYNFHDAVILALRQENGGALYIDLDCDGCFSHRGYCTLKFTGVQSLEIPENIIGGSWLYTEIHTSECGNFDFQALLYSNVGLLTLHELRIVADGVMVEFVQA